MNRESIYQQLRSHLAYLRARGRRRGPTGAIGESPLRRDRPHRVHRGAPADRGGGNQGKALADAHEAGQLPHQMDPGRLRLCRPARD